MNTIPLSKPSDEYFTPDYAIKPLLEFIPKDKIVWCPFDTKASGFVALLKQHGCKVIHSHIRDGYDFFKHEPTEPYDYIISNPPFSLRTFVLERLFSFNKPFAMLLGLNGMFEGKRFALLKAHQFELLLFDKRISYFKSYTDKKTLANPPFSSAYLTSNLLPCPIVMRPLGRC